MPACQSADVNDQHLLLALKIEIGRCSSADASQPLLLSATQSAVLPAGTPNPTCVPVSAHKVGDSWSAGPYTVSLVAGIQ